jgi:hypothetical protein
MIVEGIEDLHGVRTWSDLKKWMQDSGTKLEKLAGTDGFDTINGREFQSGEGGRVWKLKGQDAVLKVSLDPDEIEIAQMIEGQNLPSFVTIYKSINVKGVNKEGEKVPAQIRIQELCYPIDWSGLINLEEAQLLEWIQKYLDQALASPEYNGKIDPEFAEEFIRAAYEIDEYEPNENQNLSSSEIQIVMKALQFGTQLIQDVQKLTGEPDLHNVDLHDGNVMQNKDGQWKMIDF